MRLRGRHVAPRKAEAGDGGARQVRLLQRRARRLIGREYPVEEASDLGSDPSGAGKHQILAGPELVSSNVPLPPMTRRSATVREQILDAAEFLFSKWGYTGVSIRDVTDLAEMRLANVNYYFGSKQNLYTEVLRRRAEVLSRDRLAAIEAAIASDLTGAAFVEALVDAYMAPALKLALEGGEGWRNFFQLIGHITFSRLWPEQISPYFNAPAERFVDALESRFPQTTAFDRQAISLLIIGPVIFMLARTGRVETYREPAFSSDDLEALAPDTRRFVIGGVCAVLGLAYRG